jgi:hypothetical protein
VSNKRLAQTMYRDYLKLLVGLAILVVFTGCGGTYNSHAEGTVTLDGKPLSFGWVAYHAKSGGPAAYSPIEANGSYSIRTGSEVGLPSGDYQVTVTANEAPTQMKSKDGGPMPTGKQITPAWYGSKDMSGLTVSVKPGSNTINLELKSQPPAGLKPGQKAS